MSNTKVDHIFFTCIHGSDTSIKELKMIFEKIRNSTEDDELRVIDKTSKLLTNAMRASNSHEGLGFLQEKIFSIKTACEFLSGKFNETNYFNNNNEAT